VMNANATASGTISVYTDSQCGNNAWRFVDSNGQERTAFGYSVLSSYCQGFFPNSAYIEIGDINGNDTNDTSFIIPITHTTGGSLPAGQYQAFKINGGTGAFTFGVPNGSGGGVVAGVINANGQWGFGTSTTAATVDVLGTGHFDCTGGNTAAAQVLTAECNTATNGIRYTYANHGLVMISENDSDGGVLASDIAGLSFRGSISGGNPTSGTLMFQMTPTKNTSFMPVIVGQTKFTTTGCSVSSTTGSGTAGTITSGTTGACTVTITMNGATGMTAPNGWACAASDQTTANLIRQTASTTTTCTISGTTVTGDVIVFSAQAF